MSYTIDHRPWIEVLLLFCYAKIFDETVHKFKEEQANRTPISPKNFLEILILLRFNFLAVRTDTETVTKNDFQYTVSDQQKLVALLLFYYSSRDEEIITTWREDIIPLPPTIKFNWQHFCRAFTNRATSTHSWADGPPEMGKYINIAKDLLQPAIFDSEAFRNVARRTASSKEEKSKRKSKHQISS